jgi:quercetin dioxygenase-like cupin family protein
MDREIRIVHRDVIPLIQEIQQAGDVHQLGELRDFSWSDQLRAFMPDAAEFSISWVQLGPDEVLQPHTHPIQTMLVIYAGSGGMLGDLRRPLKKGDIVVVPPGCAHGFVGGPDRLSGLSIQFGQGLYSDPGRARVVFSGEGSGFESTTRQNESRLDQHQSGPLFELLSDGTLQHPDKRRVHLDHLRRWLVGYHQALLAFQASSPPEASVDLALEGPLPLTKPAAGDVVLEALADWFAYRMYVLDSHEKAAVVHLVLGQAIEAYFRRAAPVLAEPDLLRQFESLASHKGVELSLKQLRNQAAGAHPRLQQILGEAWDMVRAMSDRMAALARAA